MYLKLLSKHINYLIHPHSPLFVKLYRFVEYKIYIYFAVNEEESVQIIESLYLHLCRIGHI